MFVLIVSCVAGVVLMVFDCDCMCLGMIVLLSDSGVECVGVLFMLYGDVAVVRARGVGICES